MEKKESEEKLVLLDQVDLQEVEGHLVPLGMVDLLDHRVQLVL